MHLLRHKLLSLQGTAFVFQASRLASGTGQQRPPGAVSSHHTWHSSTVDTVDHTATTSHLDVVVATWWLQPHSDSSSPSCPIKYLQSTNLNNIPVRNAHLHSQHIAFVPRCNARGIPPLRHDQTSSEFELSKNIITCKFTVGI